MHVGFDNNTYLLQQKGEKKMLYMAITTWDPEKRDALIRSRGKGPQNGGKIIGEWVAIGGGRNFRVIEYDDPIGYACIGYDLE